MIPNKKFFNKFSSFVLPAPIIIIIDVESSENIILNIKKVVLKSTSFNFLFLEIINKSNVYIKKTGKSL